MTPSPAPHPPARGTAAAPDPTPGAAAERFKACGKQVLEGSDHFADARDPATAAAVVEAMNALDAVCAACRRALCSCTDAAWAGRS